MRSKRMSQVGVERPSLHDQWFIFSVFCIVIMGLLMMTSASIVISDKQTHQPFYFLFKQLVYLTLGIGLGIGVLQYHIKQWERWSSILLIGVLFLLILVLIPGIGHRVNGSARWVGIGPLGFQVSELSKLAIVLYMAGYLKRQYRAMHEGVMGFVKPIVVLGLVAALLLKEPDFGATVVVTVTSFCMLFLAGMPLRYFVTLLIVAVMALIGIAVSAPYRLLRLTSFMDPWARPFDTGYQLTQSLIAFGRGGWTGLGLGNSIQKMFYLPEAHTDFLFAVIVEELGIIGAVSVIALFSLMITRIFLMGRAAQRLGRHYAGFLAYGLGCWISIQVLVNIGVNSGLLPTKGLTLPFMSYGGSSVLVNCLVIALLIRIDHENRLAQLGLGD